MSTERAAGRGLRPFPRKRRRCAGAVVAGLLAATLCATLGATAAQGAPSSAAPATAAPTCQEWQTLTQVTVSGPPVTRSTSGTVTVKPRAAPVCRNAPPIPFPQPVWDPDTVVGGPRLGSSGLVVDLPPGTPAPPVVPDVSYVVADLDTGEILAAKAPHAWLRPASTLKALTALTLIPRLDARRVIVATAAEQSAEGTRVGMLVGNRYSVGQLFDALLMSSANDAAYALADAAGGYAATARLMNETAASIGAHDTVVRDPSGLDEADQRSSAYDLALIGRAAMKLPEFRAYVAKRDAVFPGGKDKLTGRTYKPFHLANINVLLARYPGAIGIKPGRTNRAQHTFIGAATRRGRTLIVSQMGSTTGDWKDTAALLDWAFAHAGQVTPVGRLVDPGQAPPPSVAASQMGSNAGAGVGPTDAGVEAVSGALSNAGLVRADTAATVVTGFVALLVGAGLAVGLLLLRRRHSRP